MHLTAVISTHSMTVPLVEHSVLAPLRTLNGKLYSSAG